MLGVLLLIIALVCYFNPRSRWFSLFLYVSFMIGYNGGFGLWTNEVIGFKNNDLAVIYTFVISFYLLVSGQYKLPKMSFIRQYKWVIAFLCCSMVFSYIHYGFGAYDILQGSRGYLLLFSLPILYRASKIDFEKLMKALMWVTTLTAVLYILQIVVGHPIMPYKGDYSIDKSTGLVRLYNSPPLNTFFLTLTFVYSKYFGKKVNIFRIIYFVALMCTLGRTAIFTGLLAVMLSIAFTGKVGKVFKTALIVGVLFLPFIGTISNRFEKGETDDDIETILKGGATTYENSSDGGTMTYRLAWMLERSYYLIKRPLGEQIFGLGLITDSYSKLPYHFRLGVYNEDIGMPRQMSTSDIAYGNLLTHWGFGGTFVYMVFVISLIIFFIRYRKSNLFITVCAALLLMMLVESFAGNTLSLPKNFVIYFIALSTLIHNRI